MNDERRDVERAHTFRTVDLITTGPDGGEITYPIILRDAGDFGVGGVYVGQNPFTPEGDATLKDAEGGERRVRIAWTKKVADYVHMVGIEACD